MISYSTVYSPVSRWGNGMDIPFRVAERLPDPTRALRQSSLFERKSTGHAIMTSPSEQVDQSHQIIPPSSQCNSSAHYSSHRKEWSTWTLESMPYAEWSMRAGARLIGCRQGRRRGAVSLLLQSLPRHLLVLLPGAESLMRQDCIELKKADRYLPLIA